VKFVLENILLAVDIKDASNEAMQRACDFASKFNAKITALFVSTDTFNHFTDSKKFLEGFCTSKNIGLKIIDRKGKIYDEVVRLQKCSNFSLVLVRAIEDSGWRLFKRNDVSKVVVNSLCPVISFKENSDTFSFKNILLPIEDSKTTRQKVPICSELARAFGSTIHILGVSKSAKNEKKENIQSHIRQTERFLTERGIKYINMTWSAKNEPDSFCYVLSN